MQSNQLRIGYLDALRTVACFAVVMLHVTALNTYNVEFISQEWNIFMFYESVVNWAVPTFVMISGAVMLNKDYAYKRILMKTLKISQIFFVWSALYLIFDFCIYGMSTYSDNALWLQVFLQGHYHMWYLIMLAGLYLIVPIMKGMIDKASSRKAYVLLAIVLTFTVPTVMDLLQQSKVGGVLRNTVVGAFYRALTNVHDDLNFHLTMGFAAYFVIGYEMVHFINISAHKCWILGCLCFFIGIVITFFEIMISNSKEAAGFFMQHYQVAILLQSAGILLIMKSLQGRKIVLWLGKISPLTLGIYIIHPMIIETLQRFGITSLSFNPVLFIPLLTLAIFTVAALIVYFLVRTKGFKYLITM